MCKRGHGTRGCPTAARMNLRARARFRILARKNPAATPKTVADSMPPPIVSHVYFHAAAANRQDHPRGVAVDSKRATCRFGAGVAYAVLDAGMMGLCLAPIRSRTVAAAYATQTFAAT